jgi:hypothetical protein
VKISDISIQKNRGNATVSIIGMYGNDIIAFLNWYRSVGLQRRLSSINHHLQELNLAADFSISVPFSHSNTYMSCLKWSIIDSIIPHHGNYLVVFLSAFITASLPGILVNKVVSWIVVSFLHLISDVLTSRLAWYFLFLLFSDISSWLLSPVITFIDIPAV